MSISWLEGSLALCTDRAKCGAKCCWLIVGWICDWLRIHSQHRFFLPVHRCLDWRKNFCFSLHLCSFVILGVDGVVVVRWVPQGPFFPNFSKNPLVLRELFVFITFNQSPQLLNLSRPNDWVPIWVYSICPLLIYDWVGLQRDIVGRTEIGQVWEDWRLRRDKRGVVS